MIFEPVDGFLVKGFSFNAHAKGAVIHIAAGAACYLAHFCDVQIAKLKSVEFPGGGKRHMVDIHVEAHANCIGGDDVINVA